MEPSELRELGPTELRSRVHQWKEELFRTKLKRFGGEIKDTTSARKLRRNIARGLTILNHKLAGEAAKGQA